MAIGAAIAGGLSLAKGVSGMFGGTFQKQQRMQEQRMAVASAMQRRIIQQEAAKQAAVNVGAGTAGQQPSVVGQVANSLGAQQGSAVAAITTAARGAQKARQQSRFGALLDIGQQAAITYDEIKQGQN